VKSVSYVARPEIPGVIYNATGDAMHTDGALAVITLQDCRPLNAQLDSKLPAKSFRPGNYVFRYIRRSILTIRNDMFRANIIYGAYDVGRRGVMALRHQQPSNNDNESIDRQHVTIGRLPGN